jgi:hypothetical protein
MNDDFFLLIFDPKKYQNKNLICQFPNDNSYICKYNVLL